MFSYGARPHRKNNCYTCILLTKREVKMAGYSPSSLFVFLWTETKSIPSHFDRTSFVNKRFITWHHRTCLFSSTEKKTSYMLKWWRKPLYPDWINVENTIIWLVIFLKSKCQTSKCNKQMPQNARKNLQNFLFQPQNWCQNGLNFNAWVLKQV